MVGGPPSPPLPRFGGVGALNPLSREAGEGWGGGAADHQSLSASRLNCRSELSAWSGSAIG